jgi:hypothetical protein
LDMVLVGPVPGSILVLASSAKTGRARATTNVVAKDRVRIIIDVSKNSGD